MDYLKCRQKRVESSLNLLNLFLKNFCDSLISRIIFVLYSKCPFTPPVALLLQASSKKKYFFKCVVVF